MYRSLSFISAIKQLCSSWVFNYVNMNTVASEIQASRTRWESKVYENFPFKNHFTIYSSLKAELHCKILLSWSVHIQNCSGISKQVSNGSGDIAPIHRNFVIRDLLSQARAILNRIATNFLDGIRHFDARYCSHSDLNQNCQVCFLGWNLLDWVLHAHGPMIGCSLSHRGVIVDLNLVGRMSFLVV